MRLAFVAAGVYLLLLGTIVADLYDPLTRGEDDSWLVVLLAISANVALGAAVRRWWALLLPTVACVGGFAATYSPEEPVALVFVVGACTIAV